MTPVASVLCRPGDQRKPSGHVALDDVAFGSAWRRGSLRGQDLEVIAMKRRGLRTIPADWAPFLCCLRHQLTERTPLLTLGRRPVQAVLRARIAVEFRRVHARGLAAVSLLRVASLRGDVRAGGLNGRPLVAPDSPRQHLLLPSGRVEAPSARLLDQRHRERPLLVADDERLPIGPRIRQTPLLPSSDREHLAIPASGRGIRRRDQLLTIWSEDRQQFVEVPCFHGVDERLDRIFRRTERALRSSLSRSPARKRGNPEQRAGACQRETPTQEPAGVLRSICGAHHDRLSESADHRRRPPPPPPPRELLRLRCPRSLEDRCDAPLEYPENASEPPLLR